MLAALNKKSAGGFSLIEIMLSVAIMMILISIVVAIGRSFNNTENLANSGKLIEEKIKFAKAKSLGAYNNTNYGVHFESGRIVVFTGSTYVDGAPTNEVFDLPDNIDIYNISLTGGEPDLVFNRLTGTTGDFGTIGVRVTNDTSKNKQIVINAEGQSSFGAFTTSTGTQLLNAKHVHFNLGWNIENENNMHLEWIDGFGAVIVPLDVAMVSYFNADKSKFDWEGTVTVNGVDQKIRVHSWLDASNNTVLCVMRYETENEKLNIYFDGYIKEIATYENASGVITVTKNADVLGAMEIQ